MNINIERAKPSDAAALLDYLKCIGGETDNLTFGSDGIPFSIEAETMFLTQIENSCNEIMLVAKDGDKIVGNASLSRLSRRMNHRGDLSVSVLKGYWNIGIGRKLINKLIEFAKENDFEIIDLQVRSDNIHAIHLYESFGFKKIGCHPAFFKINGEYIDFEYMYLQLS